MVTAVSRTEHQRASLAEQIEQLEHRVIERQQRVRGQAKALARDVRHRLTSPETLLAVGGVGFIFGLISGRREAAGPPPQSMDRPSSANWRQIALNVVFNAMPAAIPKIMEFFAADSITPARPDSTSYDQPVS